MSCSEFSRNLENDVVSETSGNFQRLLVSAVNANRDESTAVDSAKADHDARAIFEVGSLQQLSLTDGFVSYVFHIHTFL